MVGKIYLFGEVVNQLVQKKEKRKKENCSFVNKRKRITDKERFLITNQQIYLFGGVVNQLVQKKIKKKERKLFFCQ